MYLIKAAAFKPQLKNGTKWSFSVIKTHLFQPHDGENNTGKRRDGRDPIGLVDLEVELDPDLALQRYANFLKRESETKFRATACERVWDYRLDEEVVLMLLLLRIESFKVLYEHRVGLVEVRVG